MTLKINLIKPGMDVFDPVKVDTSTYGGMSEIKGVYNILKNHNFDVSYGMNFKDADILVIFNSACNDKEVMDKIKAFKKRKVQIVTDLNLRFSTKKIGEHIVSSQSPYLGHYWPYHMLCLKYQPSFVSNNTDRKFLFGYAGGTRNGKRDNYYNKYLLPSKSYITWIHTSSKVFGEAINVFGKIPYDVLQKKYAQTKFSLVIADDNYNEINFLTQRPFELLANGVIPLVDINYDKNNIIGFPENLRVQNANMLKDEMLKCLSMNNHMYSVRNQCDVMLQNAYDNITNQKTEEALIKILTWVVK